MEAEHDDVNRYKASKQADVLMLLYLLSSDELGSVLDRLDYVFQADQIPMMVDYYLARTSHGSTLSAVVHSWVLARANRDRAMPAAEAFGPAAQFNSLLAFDSVHGIAIEMRFVHDTVVEHAHVVFADSSEGQFGLERDAELAHHQHIEWRT